MNICDDAGEFNWLLFTIDSDPPLSVEKSISGQLAVACSV